MHSGTSTLAHAPAVASSGGHQDLLRRLNAGLIRWPGLFVPLTLLIYSFGKSDYTQFCIFAQDPFAATLPPSTQFLYSSPLSLWIGAALVPALGLTAAYVATGLLGWLFAALAWRAYARCFAPELRGPLLLIVFSTPVLVVFTRWAGKGDIYLAAAYLIILARGGRDLASGLAACALVLAHREIGTIVLAAHLFLRRTVAWPILAGAAVGFAITTIYVNAVLPPAASTRLTIVFTNGMQILRANSAQPISHVVLGLSWFWMFLARRLYQRFDWRVAVYLLSIFALAFSTIDFSRDLILLALPLVLTTAEWAVAQGSNAAGVAAIWPFPMLFLLQSQFLWENRLIDSGWPIFLWSDYLANVKW